MAKNRPNAGTLDIPIQRTIFGRGLSVRVLEIASRQHGESLRECRFLDNRCSWPSKKRCCDPRLKDFDFFGQRPAFFGPPFMDLCFGIEIRAAMSDEFEGLDATEKAGIRAALIRCRVLAAKIANDLRNKRPEHFVDKLSLQTFTPPLSAYLEPIAHSKVCCDCTVWAIGFNEQIFGNTNKQVPAGLVQKMPFRLNAMMQSGKGRILLRAVLPTCPGL